MYKNQFIALFGAMLLKTVHIYLKYNDLASKLVILTIILILVLFICKCTFIFRLYSSIFQCK